MLTGSPLCLHVAPWIRLTAAEALVDQQNRADTAELEQIKQ